MLALIKISKPEDVESAIKDAAKNHSNKPLLLEFELQYEANVWPIVPPGGSSHQMLGVDSCTLPLNPTEKKELEKIIKR